MDKLSESHSAHKSPEQIAQRALEYSGNQLGSASRRAVNNLRSQALILARIRSGGDFEDAVLAEVHRVSIYDGEVAQEFLEFFRCLISRQSVAARSPFPSHHNEHSDLIQSVIIATWLGLKKTHFKTKNQFLAYLNQKTRWKSINRIRRSLAKSRCEDARVHADLEQVVCSATGSTPSSIIQCTEEDERLEAAIGSLPNDKQNILIKHYSGESISAVARELGLSKYRVSQILRQALEEVRRMM